jgi:anti-anti-sigma regulatory factor
MASPDPLYVTVEPLDDASLVRVAGEIDVSTIAKLRRELYAAREEGATGLHLLLEASRDSAGSEWGFFILRPSHVVQRLIAVSGTADLLTLVDPAAERVLG